jgi:hypothetical protein
MGLALALGLGLEAMILVLEREVGLVVVVEFFRQSRLRLLVYPDPIRLSVLEALEWGVPPSVFARIAL